jgi:hypothetical protein
VFAAENSTASFFCSKSRYNGPPARVSRVLPSKTETSKTEQTCVLGQKGWIGCARCGKFKYKFFCSKSRYNGPPGRVLRSCTIENRNSENATNMSFGSNGVDWVCSLRKIQLQVFFVQKVAITDLPGEFRTVFPSKTETPKKQQT